MIYELFAKPIIRRNDEVRVCAGCGCQGMVSQFLEQLCAIIQAAIKDTSSWSERQGLSLSC